MQSVSKTIEIARGVHLPLIGIGTWQLTDAAKLDAVLDAGLATGYRLIDTAAGYQNESAIGEALKVLLPKHGLQRSDLFITSKLPPSDQGRGLASACVRRSLQSLGTDYLDLYLIHHPGAAGLRADDPKIPALRKESWLELEALVAEGKLRAIGVSNYLVKHLRGMEEFAKITPAVNQCEFHPYLVRRDLLDYCQAKGIAFQAYSSLGSPSGRAELKSDPVVVELAGKFECPPETLLLAWAINQGIGVLPRTSSVEHVRSNFKAIEVRLSDGDIKRLSALSRDKHFCWTSDAVI